MNNIFIEPAEPFVFFSYSDFLIITVINLILYILSKNQLLKANRISKIIIGIFFFIIVPIISTQIELRNVNNKFEIVDGFNVLYIIFKIPIWWIIGILNIYIIKIKLMSR
ncbi:hypothetical protein JOE44_004034 [Chryseobacterium sp. PvR013]|nr:hypothetical protein [Chryseobacterium sp. PvR013]